ncbi:hypothetical protein [Nocardioides sp. cx-173]|uniref:hypothetical protein n=1 Tax=Nocardioides sp. cx-173 TaxID=2898796 RepID=UPI001E2DDBDD|nr:hypothetical protein [Nocardioides sp. cx-173]MCD4526936.1 hypothetical protein [Nocardioides sp. cx-173]UGB41276.1 hypothetical protein LQ940_18135 [Nocardioides sp. cx-173]
MRIAVLMAGELRTLSRLERAHGQWLGNLRTRHEVDLFVHSWEQTASPPAALAANLRALARLEPSSTVVEPQPDLPDEVVFPSSSTGIEIDDRRSRHFASMWRSLERGYTLVRGHESHRNGPYDLVVRTRPDVLWNVEGEVERAIRSGRSRLPRRLASRLTPSDLAGVLVRSDADTLFGLYGAIPAFREAYLEYGYRTFVAEFALGFYVDRVGLRWDPFLSDLVVLRESGSKVWFRQDPAAYALQATRPLVSPDGDALQVTRELGFAARVRSDLHANLGAGGHGLDELAELAVAAHELMGRRDPQALTVCANGVARPGMARARLRNTFLAGLAIEGARASSHRPTALALRMMRHPARTGVLASAMGRVALHRQRRAIRFEVALWVITRLRWPGRRSPWSAPTLFPRLGRESP